MLSKATIAHTKQRFVVLFENLSVCESQEINEEYLENIFISEKCWGLANKRKKTSKSIWMPWGKINVKRTYKSFSYCTQWTKSPENINSFY